MKTLRVKASVLLLGLSALGAGCGAGEGAEQDEWTDGFAELEQPLGEPGCGTMACTTANSCAPVAIPTCGPPTFATSPNASYGSATCPNQFVARNVTPPTTGSRVLSMWRWKGAKLTAANCATARVESALYAKTSASPLAAPVLVGTEIYVGKWSNNVCTLTSSNSKPSVVPAGLKEVRTTVKATLGGVKQRVEAGFWHIC